MGNILASLAGHDRSLVLQQGPLVRAGSAVNSNLDFVAEGLAIFLREHGQYQRHPREKSERRSNQCCHFKKTERLLSQHQEDWPLTGELYRPTGYSVRIRVVP